MYQELFCVVVPKKSYVDTNVAVKPTTKKPTTKKPTTKKPTTKKPAERIQCERCELEVAKSHLTRHQNAARCKQRYHAALEAKRHAEIIASAKNSRINISDLPVVILEAIFEMLQTDSAREKHGLNVYGSLRRVCKTFNVAITQLACFEYRSRVSGPGPVPSDRDALMLLLSYNRFVGLERARDKFGLTKPVIEALKEDCGIVTKSVCSRATWLLPKDRVVIASTNRFPTIEAFEAYQLKRTAKLNTLRAAAEASREEKRREEQHRAEQRKEKLLAALRRVGVTFRADSRLCEKYMRGSTRYSAAYVAARMAQMKFLHANTRYNAYKNELFEARRNDARRGYWSDYDDACFYAVREAVARGVHVDDIDDDIDSGYASGNEAAIDARIPLQHGVTDELLLTAERKALEPYGGMYPAIFSWQTVNVTEACVSRTTD